MTISCRRGKISHKDAEVTIQKQGQSFLQIGILSHHQTGGKKRNRTIQTPMQGNLGYQHGKLNYVRKGDLPQGERQDEIGERHINKRNW